MKRRIIGTMQTSMLVGEAESRNFVVAWLKEQAGLGQFDIIDTDTLEIIRREEVPVGLGRNMHMELAQKSREPATEAQAAAWIVITNTCNRGEFSGDTTNG